MLWLRCMALCALTAFAMGEGTRVKATNTGIIGKRQDSESSGAPSPEHPPPPVCDADKYSVKPFCLPDDGKSVEVGAPYFVTWNPEEFPKNTTVIVGLLYVNDTDGKSPYVSDPMPAGSFGFLSITMEETWLQDESRNNLTVYIADHDPNSGNRSSIREGPMVSLAHKPVEHYPPPPHTSINKLGLIIGLPVGLFVFFLLLLGLCVGMRKNRRIGLGNIMGSRNQGYASGQSRIERLGGRRKHGRTGAGIRMENMEEGEQYTDEPDDRNGPQETLTETERFNEVQRSQGNAFRHDVGRLKSWR